MPSLHVAVTLTGLFGYYPLVDRVNNYYRQVVQTKLVVTTPKHNALAIKYLRSRLPFMIP